VAHSKAEYPPLLTEGFHERALWQLRDVCVGAFPRSTTRGAIMDKLEQVIAEISRHGIPGELWVDGSFLTRKENPEDVDVVLRIDADVYDNGTQAVRQVVDWIISNLKQTHMCDSYVWLEYPDGHALHDESEWNRAAHMAGFGWSRDKADMKGIAVVRLPLNFQ
jgi:hypothetical protein